MSTYEGSNFVLLSHFNNSYEEISRKCLESLLKDDAKVTSLEQFKIYNKLIVQLSNNSLEYPVRFEYEHVVRILETVKEIFKTEPSLIECPFDVKVVGDLHGSMHDLIRIYGHFCVRLDWGYTPAHLANSFVFLGNYVDRGDQSLEVLMLLFSMKIAAQFSGRKLIMLRGNHETREMNYAKGFRAELHRKFDKEKADDLFDKFNDIFNHMPLACLIGNRHLCVHGGISPKLTSLEAIRRIPKPLERVDKNKLACDLLWADFKEGLKGFEPNVDRDISVCFGEDVLEETLDKFGLDCLIRSHQKTDAVVDCVKGFCITIRSWSGPGKNMKTGIVGVDERGELIEFSSDPSMPIPPDGTGDFIIELAGM